MATAKKKQGSFKIEIKYGTIVLIAVCIYLGRLTTQLF